MAGYDHPLLKQSYVQYVPLIAIFLLFMLTNLTCETLPLFSKSSAGRLTSISDGGQPRAAFRG